ncbi:MAG: type II toxin-antitoxin system VapC family toxin [Acidobacteriota bacterium]
MKLLLDTHIWLWSLLEPERLTPAVAAALSDPKTELWLSPVTVWETLMLAEGRRVELRPDARSWVAQALRSVAFQEAPLTFEVALETGRLELPHRDPADRFIAATARVFGLTLVTADQRLIGAPGLEIMPNR